MEVCFKQQVSVVQEHHGLDDFLCCVVLSKWAVRTNFDCHYLIISRLLGRSHNSLVALNCPSQFLASFKLCLLVLRLSNITSRRTRNICNRTMDSREATLQAIFDGVVGEQGRMTIREFRILWQRLSLPFLPDHSTNVMRAFKLIDVEGQGYFQLTQFIERLKPLLEFIELKRDSKSKLRASGFTQYCFHNLELICTSCRFELLVSQHFQDHDLRQQALYKRHRPRNGQTEEECRRPTDLVGVPHPVDCEASIGLLAISVAFLTAF